MVPASVMDKSMSIHMPARISIHISVNIPIHISLYKSVQMCIHPHAHIYMPIHISMSMSVHMPIHMPLHMSVDTFSAHPQRTKACAGTDMCALLCIHMISSVHGCTLEKGTTCPRCCGAGSSIHHGRCRCQICLVTEVHTRVQSQTKQKRIHLLR